MKKPVNLIKVNSEYILISDDLFGKGDLVFTNEKGKSIIGVVQKVLINKFAMVDVGGVVHRLYNCKKVIARESQIYSVEISEEKPIVSGLSRLSIFNNFIAEHILKEKLEYCVDFEEGMVFNKTKFVLFAYPKKTTKLA